MGNKEHTQQDLVVLSLAAHREWRRAFQLERTFVGNEAIGSEADTRLYEVFDKQVSDTNSKETTRKIDGAEYTIQTKKVGADRLWRAFLTKARPKQVVTQLPTGEVRVQYV